VQLKVLLLIVKVANLVVNARLAYQVGTYILIRRVFSTVQTDFMITVVEFVFIATIIAHCAIALIVFHVYQRQEGRLRIHIVIRHATQDIGITPLLVAVAVFFVKEDKNS